MRVMKKRRRIADVLMVIVCLSGVFGSGFLFWRDLNRTLTKNSETPVGIISYKRNGAQRRFGERLAWGSVQRDSPVYSGDLIRTADLSDAIITFDKAVEVSLSENSLIQAFYDSDTGARLELSGGAISVDAGDKGMTISSGGKILTINAGSSVSMDAGEEFTVRVMSGSASLLSAGESRDLDAGTALSVDASGYIEEKPQVTVLTPLPGHAVLSPVPVPVAFLFQTSGFPEGEHVRVDLASDRRFSGIIKTVDSAPDSGMTVELAPGVYWWRAYPAGSGSGGAASGKLSVVNAPAPVPVRPGGGERFAYRDSPPEIRFRWTAGGTDAGEEAVYVLEAADNPGMLRPRLSERVDGYSYASGSLGEGTWYWRVTPRYPGNYGGTALSSAVSAFTIEHGAAEAPPPPELPPAETPPEKALPPRETSPPRTAPPPRAAPPSREAPPSVPLPGRPEALRPSHNAVIDAAYIQRNLSRDLASGFFMFNWKAVPGANAYSFELYRAKPPERPAGDGTDGDAGMVPLISVPLSPDTGYRLENLAVLENGDYIWRLTALSIAPDGTVERRGETAEYRFTFSVPRPGAPALTVPETLYGF